MKRILFSFFCFLSFLNAEAQYTTIINSNKPGKTETAYAVGTDVLQFENTTSFKTLTFDNDKTNSYTNNLDVRYGLFLHQLEVNLNFDYTYEVGNVYGPKRLALGIKYLLFDFNSKETPEKLRSWDKRYGFWENGILPAIAIGAYYNTPFTHTPFPNGGQGSASFSLILQNNINRKLRINNQFEYNYVGADVPEFAYNISSAYLINQKLNPFVQFGYYNSDLYSYFSVGMGAPYLINKDLSVSIYSDGSFAGNYRQFEFGINASYRIDHHEDDWVYKESKLELDKKWQEEQNIDDELMEEELGINQQKSTKSNFFSKIFSVFNKKKSKSNTEADDPLETNSEKKEKKGFFKKLFKKKKKSKENKDEDEVQDVISDY